MSPGFRKATLTAHVMASVGWLGAVVAYLVLAIVGLTDREPETARAAYLSMEVIGWRAIVPLCVAAFVTGLWEALATEWGLFRHYWVVAKLGLTAFATTILLLHMPAVNRVAESARDRVLPIVTPHGAQAQLLVHAAGGLVILTAIAMISIFKPWGRTPFGRA
jgi:hypothetical protein